MLLKCCLLLVSAIDEQAIAEAQGPRIFAPTTEATIYLTEEFEEQEHTFVFRNIGSEVLLINGVNSSCGCLYKLDAPDQLAPGQTGTLTINYRSASGSALNPHVVLESNDPITPLLFFSIEILNAENVQVSPQALEFSFTDSEVDASETLVVVYRDRTEFVEPSVSSHSECLSVVLTDVQEGANERRFLFEVRCRLPKTLAALQEVLTVDTHDLVIPVIDVEVRAQRELLWRAKPNRILMGKVASGSLVEREIVLYPAGTNNTETIRAEVDHPAFAVDVVDKAETGVWKLVVRLVGVDVAGSLKTQVSVSGENGRLLAVVPVQAFVRE